MKPIRATSLVVLVLACCMLSCVPVFASAQQQPRELSEQDLEKIHRSVKKSKARTEEQVRADAIRAEQMAEESRQDEARAEEESRLANEQRAADEARNEAEREAEMQQAQQNFAATKERIERVLEEGVASRVPTTKSQTSGDSGAAADADSSSIEAGDDPAPSRPSTPQPGKPLRFVLDIGLVNKPGDTVNPTCYSNVITRPGPPGWGGSGFLPDGSAEQAQQEVESLRDSFIAACRASGREITSEGNFHWTWNQTGDGDQQVSNAHARYREDVSVNL